MTDQRDDLPVAAVQLNSTDDKVANLAAAETAIRAAADAGAQLVVLPELFTCLADFPTILAQAEPIPGPTTDRMSRLAAELGIHLCAGSICETSDQAGRGYNTATLFDDTGQLLAKYRKMHLFQIDHSDQLRLSEPDFMLPGDQTVVVRTKLGRLGLATCYDLRFPELFRALLDQQVEIVLFPSAFTYFTGAAHWQTLIRARAIENQCFFVAANQVGYHNATLRSFGHSLIVDGWGNELAVADESHPATIHASLEWNAFETFRRRIPATHNRRLHP
jgi:predicted amidohydrolase